MEIINGSITYSHLLLVPYSQKSRNGIFMKGEINKESYLLCYFLLSFSPSSFISSTFCVGSFNQTTNLEEFNCEPLYIQQDYTIIEM